MQNPINKWLHFAWLIVASWCVMIFVHEAGHVLCGWCGGGTLVRAELRPWRLPYSLFEPDPHPLVTLWGGPTLGAAIPLVVAWLVQRPWMWFVAYFCVLANGVYIATAWFTQDRFLDTARLMAHGANPVTVVIYCVLTIGIGYVGFRQQCVLVLSVGREP
jgi:hypothetical protein